VVFLVQSPDGLRSLWVRPIGSEKAQQVSGTENASGMFWSADSKHLGFIVQGKLKKVDPFGGAPQDIADIGGARQFAWSRNGVILFGRSDGVLVRVDDSGGEVQTSNGTRCGSKGTHPDDTVVPPGWESLPLCIGEPGEFGVLHRLAGWKNTSDPRNPVHSHADYRSCVCRTWFYFDGRRGKADGAAVQFEFTESRGRSGHSYDILGEFTVTDTGLLTFRKNPPEPNKQLHGIFQCEFPIFGRWIRSVNPV
jgi:hypothetical protein